MFHNKSQQKQHDQTQYGPTKKTNKRDKSTEKRNAKALAVASPCVLLSCLYSSTPSTHIIPGCSVFSISTAKPINFHKLKKPHSDWRHLENNRASSWSASPAQMKPRARRSKAAILRKRFYITGVLYLEGRLGPKQTWFIIAYGREPTILQLDTEYICARRFPQNYHIIYISLMAPLHAEREKNLFSPKYTAL